MHDQSWLWHRRLGHANMDLISQLNKDELVRGLPKINFQKDKVYEACQMGKKIKKALQSLALEVIMGENLRILTLRNIAISMVSITIFRLLELLNKMG